MLAALLPFAEIGMVNNLFAVQKDSYWTQTGDTVDQNPVLHCWSLGVEEQFYFIYPALALALYSATILQPPLGAKQAAPNVTCVALLPPQRDCLQLLAAANGIGAYLAAIDTQWSNYVFYLLPFRFWQLMSGCMLHDIMYACP
jgi:peptidoglycan/LPS O-acetylase OafA/YrhL